MLLTLLMLLMSLMLLMRREMRSVTMLEERKPATGDLLRSLELKSVLSYLTAACGVNLEKRDWRQYRSCKNWHCPLQHSL